MIENASPEWATWSLQCITLVGISLLHEDVALVTAGMMVARHGLPASFGLVALCLGAVTGDVGIYSLGALAHRVPRLRRWVIGPNVDRVHDWLDRHFLRVVALARVTPGVLFPSYVACGWFGLPLRRFLPAAWTASILYTAVAYTLMLAFGETILRKFGYGAWAAVAVLLVLFTALRTRRPRWGMAARAAAAHPFVAVRKLFERHWGGIRAWHEGMPGLEKLKHRVAPAERIPPWLFYLPLGAYWAWLALRYRGLTLPCAANPRLEAGGFWGESKTTALRHISGDQTRWVAPFVTLHTAPAGELAAEDDCRRALEAMAGAGLEFPLVVKPDIGWQGFGVRLVATPEQLRDYLAEYPRGEDVILQRYVAYDGEAGVLYVRIPGEECGRVLSLTLRYFAFVVGDGRSSLRELIRHDERARFKAAVHLGERPQHAGMDEEDLQQVPADREVVRLAFIGSIRVGGLYRDARAEITPALSARFDAIAKSMPEFYYGRFDIRFASLEQLRAGEEFAIFEVNGAGAEAIHVWDPELSLGQVYRSLFAAIALLFRIGRLNRARGARPCSVWRFLALERRQHRLILRYPPST